MTKVIYKIITSGGQPFHTEKKYKVGDVISGDNIVIKIIPMNSAKEDVIMIDDLLIKYLNEKSEEMKSYEVHMTDRKKIPSKDKKREYHFTVRARNSEEARKKAEEQKPIASVIGIEEL